MTTLDVHTLQRLRRVLNLSAIAEEAGLNKNTLLAKVARGRELTSEEVTRINSALQSLGITIQRPTWINDRGQLDHLALSKLPLEVRTKIMRELMLGAESCYGPDDIIHVSVEISDDE